MTQIARFIPARELSRDLAGIIEPRLRETFPDIPLALALIGPGSDVLGYDTARSMDHDWGPRLTIVVPEASREHVLTVRDERLDDLLPANISGFPTRFSLHPDGTMKSDPEGPIHRLEVTSVDELLRQYLLTDSSDSISDSVWLSTPMQSLLELTAGQVFVDDSGELTSLRAFLGFYPDHIWRYQLAGFWMRISQVQPFIGRCFETHDRVGAIAIAMGVVRDLMRIGLLQSRQFAPYSKWLGSAVTRIEVGRSIGADLEHAVKSTTEFRDLEAAINAVGRALIQQLNDLKLITAVHPVESQFHTRPWQVLPAEEIALALKESAHDLGLVRFDAVLGGIDVITDSTDALGSPAFRMAIRTMFEAT